MPLHPLILNTFDNQGGAAIATYRLHCGLRSIGINSHMLVQSKKTDDHNVVGSLAKWQRNLAIFGSYLEIASYKLYYRKHQKALFSTAWLPENLATKVEKFNPDIVHLFWVTSGFLRIETLKKIKRPIVWTLHDMWPFTGGCHYDNECGKFKQSCGDCPLLQSKQKKDLSRSVWERKRKSWEGLPIVVVATSHWMAKMARSSSLFKEQRVEVIPNGIDTARYKPINKDA